jgi:hypothetical protein
MLNGKKEYVGILIVITSELHHGLVESYRKFRVGGLCLCMEFR